MGTKARYRYLVRTSEDGVPPPSKLSTRPRPRTSAQLRVSFGKALRTIGRSVARPAASKPRVPRMSAHRQGLIDVFDMGDHVLVVARLPGVKAEDLKLGMTRNTLIIAANSPQGGIRRDVLIAERIKIGRIEGASFKHGVLQVKLSKAEGHGISRGFRG